MAGGVLPPARNTTVVAQLAGKLFTGADLGEGLGKRGAVGIDAVVKALDITIEFNRTGEGPAWVGVIGQVAGSKVVGVAPPAYRDTIGAYGAVMIVADPN